VSISALRTLAVLEAMSEAETVFGGRTRSWTQIAALWVDLRPGGHREAGDGAGPPTLTETADAVARSGVAARGMRLKAGGEPWRIVAVRASDPRPGRMTLKLERSWP
jgi:head-tail adaptor